MNPSTDNKMLNACYNIRLCNYNLLSKPYMQNGKQWLQYIIMIIFQ